jgi:hypothetical protein
MSIDTPSIGIISHVIPDLVILQVILAIIGIGIGIMGIGIMPFIGIIPPIIGIMPFIMGIGIMPFIMGIMPFIIGIGIGIIAALIFRLLVLLRLPRRQNSPCACPVSVMSAL